MNEQRIQAYFYLIYQLLSCPQGDEPRILQENQELLDENLIELMEALAQQYRDDGKSQEAQELSDMAQELAIILGLFGYDDYFLFSAELFQKIGGNPEPQFIYPFLEDNLDKLDENMLKVLDIKVKDVLSSINAEYAAQMAGVIINFSKLIIEFPLGNIAINIELGINACTTALSILTFEAFPFEWARAKNNLGTAYFSRIKGDKADNLEQAIAILTETFKVYTFEKYPYEWAITQQNLANAYTYRIKEDKADNLERAIAACKEALKVRNFENYPSEWAMTQTTLGTAYAQRIKENKAENLEKAIIFYTQALKVYTLNDFLYEWGMTKNNLGVAYRDRIRGDKADNLEKSIAIYKEVLKAITLKDEPNGWARTKNNLAIAYRDRIRGDKADNLEKAIALSKEALKVYTFDDFPHEWAGIQHNLGLVYSERIRGDKSENLEQAIIFYIEALKVRTFETLPYDWAFTQHNLGAAYQKRIKGNKADNLEKAIRAYEEALKVHTFDAFPYEWAFTQHNLATAYQKRIKEDKADNLEMAITAYKEALKVRTFNNFSYDWAITQANLAVAYHDRMKGNKADNLEIAITTCKEVLKVHTFNAFPHEWAGTQNNLGNGYRDRKKGDKSDNLKKAIIAYTEALKVRTPKNDPFNCLQTADKLAEVHYDQKQWQLGIEADRIAIEAIENYRLQSPNLENRQKNLSSVIDVFHRIVQAYLNLNQPEKALEYIERSKGRNLVELMTQKGLKPQGVSQKTIDKLAALKQQVVNEQIRLQHQSINQNLMGSDNLTPYVQDQSYLKEYQQELDSFIKKEITPHDLNFKLTQKVQSIPFKEIKSLTDDSTCLLQWYITEEKILAFIVSADETVKVWQSSEADRKQFFDTLNNYLQLYYFKEGKKEWRDRLLNLLQNFAETLHINEIISLIPETCKRLIIIPHWFLHILPIHALPINHSPLNKGGADNESILQDKYDIQYAPSCQLLQITKQRPLNELSNLFAIQNPTKDLTFTDLEVNIISTLFDSTEIIAKDNATKNIITTRLKAPENHCYHFSCHGSFNPNNPLESSLLLAKPDTLKLGEIFELDFKQSRLVVLSACETGLIDLKSISDEYIGLPAGFLFAGTPSVVSSLWTVSDLSTSFLMMKFYEIVLDKNQDISVPVALKMAQNYLRNLTAKEFEEKLSHPNFKKVLNELEQQLSFGDFFELEDAIAVILKRIKELSPHEKPFQNPFYWAAFTATGI